MFHSNNLFPTLQKLLILTLLMGISHITFAQQPQSFSQSSAQSFKGRVRSVKTYRADNNHLQEICIYDQTGRITKHYIYENNTLTNSIRIQYTGKKEEITNSDPAGKVLSQQTVEYTKTGDTLSYELKTYDQKGGNSYEKRSFTYEKNRLVRILHQKTGEASIKTSYIYRGNMKECIIEQNNKVLNKFVYTDSSNFVTYDTNNQKIFEQTAKYNRKGEMTEKVMLYPQEKTKKVSTFKTEGLNRIEECVQTRNDSLIQRQIFKNGQLAECYEYTNGQETQFSKSTYTYNAYGDLLSITHYKDGKITDREEWQYQYDKHGNRTQILLPKGGEQQGFNYEYEYY